MGDIHMEQCLNLILFELFTKELSNLIRRIILICLPSFSISVSSRTFNIY
jgi:hypothetical protein